MVVAQRGGDETRKNVRRRGDEERRRDKKGEEGEEGRRREKKVKTKNVSTVAFYSQLQKGRIGTWKDKDKQCESNSTPVTSIALSKT